VAEISCYIEFYRLAPCACLGRLHESNQWLERFDGAFLSPSVERECIEYFLAAQPTEGSDDLADNFLIEARDAVCDLFPHSRKAIRASTDSPTANRIGSGLGGEALVRTAFQRRRSSIF
jgi:hypothetical protein